MPDSVILYSQAGNGNIKGKQEGFTNLTIIQPDSNKIGGILFPIPRYMVSVFTEDPQLELICQDAFGKKFSFKFHLDPYATGPQDFPKLNLEMSGDDSLSR